MKKKNVRQMQWWFIF